MRWRPAWLASICCALCGWRRLVDAQTSLNSTSACEGWTPCWIQQSMIQWSNTGLLSIWAGTLVWVLLFKCGMTSYHSYSKKFFTCCHTIICYKKSCTALSFNLKTLFYHFSLWLLLLQPIQEKRSPSTMHASDKVDMQISKNLSYQNNLAGECD